MLKREGLAQIISINSHRPSTSQAMDQAHMFTLSSLEGAALCGKLDQMVFFLFIASLQENPTARGVRMYTKRIKSPLSVYKLQYLTDPRLSLQKHQKR